jgi:hypothetical protein
MSTREVLNEVEFEHQMTPQYYTKIYDAIVSGILEAQPDMKFVGMALARTILEISELVSTYERCFVVSILFEQEVQISEI